MEIPTPQDTTEKEILDREFARLREEWVFSPKFGFNAFLKKWPRFVRDVEAGYSLTFVRAK